ncbi:unnamed protein product [Polarella glacialis]|uniref:Uncharacterized protein n=1 Tax=Polarella glacialis TaxID=89957 RepID=A0A813KIV1_POLGL|nr:unnamed protein product [Polarella glacialis]
MCYCGFAFLLSFVMRSSLLLYLLIGHAVSFSLAGLARIPFCSASLPFWSARCCGGAKSSDCSCSADIVEVGCDKPARVKKMWAQNFLSGVDWPELREKECNECAAARCSRHRVVASLSAADLGCDVEPFTSSPAFYTYNVPRFFAMQFRARYFVKHTGVTLVWIFAQDMPLNQDDRQLSQVDLDSKRCRWLQGHDQETGNFTSVLPLVVGLPVPLTESIDRKHRLFRGRRGFITSWVEHPDGSTELWEGEHVHSHLPPAEYVKFENGSWQIHLDLPIGVYPLSPSSRTWKIHKASGTTARRTGYFLVADFASTAHMIQGLTLEGLFLTHANATLTRWLLIMSQLTFAFRKCQVQITFGFAALIAIAVCARTSCVGSSFDDMSSWCGQRHRCGSRRGATVVIGLSRKY